MITKENLKTKLSILMGMKKYNASLRGRETKRKYNELHKDKFRAYNKEYLKKRRATCRENKTCTCCFSRPAQEKRVRCEECKNKQDIYMKKWKQKSTTEEIK
jgi:hypothetical protein